jgi:hypothetical protein
MNSSTPYASLTDVGESIGLAIGRHLDLGFRALAKGTTVANERTFLRLFSGEPHPLGNFAVLSAPVDVASARAAVEPLAAATVPSAVLFPGLQVPADVAAYLVERGYVAGGSLPAMGVDIARMEPTALPKGYEFVRIGSGPESEEWVRQFAVGYQLPLGVTEYFSPRAAGATTAADAALQFFAIRHNGVIVSTSVCYLRDGLAGIYCVSTVPEERRKGLGEHATAEPLRLAAKLGYGVGVLQSSEAGYPVYRKLGFTDYGGVPLFVRMPG